jgi:hypothetical protein
MGDARPPRLLDRVREAARLRHMSRRTEEAYVGWIRRFILFHDKRHPDQMGARGRRVLEPPRRGKRGCRSYAEPGAFRAALPLPNGARPPDRGA